jgi:tetratricopeptide (TPR) repeat protein
VLSLALFVYLLPLLLVSNFIIDIGATMGERLIYHSSLGFAMAAAWGLNVIVTKLVSKNRQSAVVALTMLLLAILSAWIIIPRNADWRTSRTLFTKDVQTAPQSILLNNNAGLELMKAGMTASDTAESARLLQEATSYFNHALGIHSDWYFPRVNLGNAYYRLGKMDSAEQTWLQVRADFPRAGEVTPYLKMAAANRFDRAMSSGKAGNIQVALLEISKAIELSPDNATYWYHLGGMYSLTGDLVQAKQAWEKALTIDPGLEDARRGLQGLQGRL